MHALFGIGWTQHRNIQGSCDKDDCAIFYPLLEVTFFLFTIEKKDACVKDSIAEDTCFFKKRLTVIKCLYGFSNFTCIPSMTRVNTKLL